MSIPNRDEVIRQRVAAFEKQLRTDGLVGCHEHVFAAVTIVSSCHPQVLQACRFMEENFRTRITLRSLARMLNMDYFELSRAFTADMQIDFSEYLARLRVRKVQERLSQPGTQILEIAKACGFPDRSGFSHTFKRLTGESARSYRTRVQNTHTPISVATVNSHPTTTESD